MKHPNGLPKLFTLAVILIPFLMTACNSSSTNEETHQYEITVNNITANQPFSPVVIFAHEPNYKIWQSGKAASVGLEHLAEGGSNRQLIEEVEKNEHYIDHATGTAAIKSGRSETITLSVKDANWVRLSFATMLVNTNDAFTGLENIKIGDLNKGESKTLTTVAWDAGTEKNTEVAGSIPGPADGGQGFNASRAGDVNFISVHQGVVTSDDGLLDSILDQSHRFDNPVAQVTVKRID